MWTGCRRSEKRFYVALGPMTYWSPSDTIGSRTTAYSRVAAAARKQLQKLRVWWVRRVQIRSSWDWRLPSPSEERRLAMRGARAHATRGPAHRECPAGLDTRGRGVREPSGVSDSPPSLDVRWRATDFCWQNAGGTNGVSGRLWTFHGIGTEFSTTDFENIRPTASCVKAVTCYVTGHFWILLTLWTRPAAWCACPGSRDAQLSLYLNLAGF